MNIYERICRHDILPSQNHISSEVESHMPNYIENVDWKNVSEKRKRQSTKETRNKLCSKLTEKDG